jgi:hypothetical protein
MNIAAPARVNAVFPSQRKYFNYYRKRMARNANAVPSVKLTISTTEQVKARLTELVGTGFYGKNASEAAERLVGEALQKKITEGIISRVPSAEPR